MLVLFEWKIEGVFFDIVDERKRYGHFALIVTAENDRYFGFRLYCNILTGRVTVDADGKRATRKARKLCKVFAEKYGNAMSGTIENPPA